MVASTRAITRSPKLQETAVTKIIELVRGGPLQRGSKDHDAVRVLQEALKRMGFTLAADGYFGGETETIIEAVQKDHGLKVDGIVGSATAAIIDGAPSQRGPAPVQPGPTFGAGAKQSDVSDYSLTVLKDIMAKAGVASVVISSTARDPFNQARVMFDNIEKTGVAAQKELYAAAGDAVIDACAAAQKAGKTPAETIKLMEAKIIALGPEKVSRRAADLTKLNVFDVTPSSIPSGKKAAWEAAIKANKSIAKFIFPPLDPGYHFEIKQPKS